MPKSLLTLFGFALTVAGCASIAQGPPLPLGHSLVRDQLVINSDFNLPPRHRLIEELADQRQRLADKLGIEVSDEPIQVYLFDTEAKYQEFISSHFPDFPERRAFFVESDTRLSVYAHWGERIAEDLRHEVAHGYLHASIPGIPLWLDEGLAEYFEVALPLDMGQQPIDQQAAQTPPTRQIESHMTPPATPQMGMNRPHLELLCQLQQQGKWQPSLARLEQLESAGHMTQTDYAESWAWVLWFLDTSDDRRVLLQNYLKQVQNSEAAPSILPLVQQAQPAADRALVEHLLRLRG